MRKKKRLWEDWEVEKLIELAERGLLTREVAAKIGRTRMAVISKGYQLGVFWSYRPEYHGLIMKMAWRRRKRREQRDHTSANTT